LLRVMKVRKIQTGERRQHLQRQVRPAVNGVVVHAHTKNVILGRSALATSGDQILAKRSTITAN
jgi:hypothetical protein